MSEVKKIVIKSEDDWEDEIFAGAVDIGDTVYVNEEARVYMVESMGRWPYGWNIFEIRENGITKLVNMIDVDDESELDEKWPRAKKAFEEAVENSDVFKPTPEQGPYKPSFDYTNSSEIFNQFDTIRKRRSKKMKEAINYGEKSERIKLDGNLFKRRRWIRPADCVRTGDTVVTPNGEEYLLTKKITSEEKKIGGGSVGQRIYSEFVTTYATDNTNFIVKVVYDSFDEVEKIQLLEENSNLKESYQMNSRENPINQEARDYYRDFDPSELKDIRFAGIRLGYNKRSAKHAEVLDLIKDAEKQGGCDIAYLDAVLDEVDDLDLWHYICKNYLGI